MTRGSVHKVFIVMLSEAKHLYVWNLERFYLSVIARGASLVAIKRVRHSWTVDCFAHARNDALARSYTCSAQKRLVFARL